MRFAAPMLVLALLLTASEPVAAQDAPQTPRRGTTASPGATESRPRQTRPQPRRHGSRVEIESARILSDDGDTAVIEWSASDRETVRILGIDTPETRHPTHDLPYAQSFGAEARGFAAGAFAVATRVELLRSPTLDPYGRTLGYFFLNGRNYSTLVVRARLAEESISRYGDNGLPAEAAEVLAAARTAGPVPFESPGDYRRRMRDVSRWMKEKGVYPQE